MICDKEKLVFIHIPRCAGHSIEHFLGYDSLNMRHISIQDYQTYTAAFKKGYNKGGRSTLRSASPTFTQMDRTAPQEAPIALELGVLNINGLGMVDYFNRPGQEKEDGFCPALLPTKPNYLGQDQFRGQQYYDLKKFYRFAFVRDPYTRAVSLYKFAKMRAGGYTGDKSFANPAKNTFLQGTKDLTQVEWETMDDHDPLHLFKPQTLYIDETVNLFRFEELLASFDGIINNQLSSTLRTKGQEAGRVLSHQVSAPEKDTLRAKARGVPECKCTELACSHIIGAWYTDESVEYINEIYKNDFEPMNFQDIK